MGGSILGAAVKRKEDPRFLRGEGTFIPNQRVDGALFLVPVRSPLPHARIASIDASAATSMPGVVGVYTAADLELPVGAPGVAAVDAEFGRPPDRRRHGAFRR